MKKKLFISYGNDNFNKVKLIVKSLKNHPLFLPIVVANTREADKYLVDKVTEGIIDSYCVIPILTKDSIYTQWINQEIGYAKAIKKRILPITEGCIMKELKGFVHNQKDLPYKYITRDDQKMREENKSFMNCFRRLIQDLEKELSPKINEIEAKSGISIDPVSNAVREHFPISSSLRKPLGIFARSGEKCPETGIWMSATTPSKTLKKSEGTIMPMFMSSNVKWKLVRYS